MVVLMVKFVLIDVEGSYYFNKMVYCGCSIWFGDVVWYGNLIFLFVLNSYS